MAQIGKFSSVITRKGTTKIRLSKIYTLLKNNESFNTKFYFQLSLQIVKEFNPLIFHSHLLITSWHFIWQGISNQPPRDLNSLLVEIRVPEDIERSPWAKVFREHLTAHQPEKEAMLDFVIVCNVLRNKESEVKQILTTKGMKWRLTDLNKDRREMLQMIGSSFFTEQCDTPIPLANQVLRDSLSRKLSQIDSVNDEDLSDVFDLVWQARCDYKVWKGGLEAAYQQFLAMKPAPPLTAVILSILWLSVFVISILLDTKWFLIFYKIKFFIKLRLLLRLFVYICPYIRSDWSIFVYVILWTTNHKSVRHNYKVAINQVL